MLSKLFTVESNFLTVVDFFLLVIWMFEKKNICSVMNLDVVAISFFFLYAQIIVSTYQLQKLSLGWYPSKCTNKSTLGITLYFKV